MSFFLGILIGIIIGFLITIVFIFWFLKNVALKKENIIAIIDKILNKFQKHGK